MISWTSLKMCYVGWKTRSIGEILENLVYEWLSERSLFKNTFWKWENAGIQHFFPFFTMFSTPLRHQSHTLIHILFVLCRRFRLMSLKFYCLVIHISHKTLEIGCAWSKGSGERLQGHHGPLVLSYRETEWERQTVRQTDRVRARERERDRQTDMQTDRQILERDTAYKSKELMISARLNI